MPIEIDTSNTEVVFSLGTTWHTVTGIAKRVDGRIWLNDSADFTSVEGRSTIAVRDLDSDNSLRDEKMRDVMDEERFNDITVHLKEVTKICDPAKMQLNETCEIVLLCDLTIRDITKEVVVAGNIALSEKGYIVTAAVDLEWAEFGIEDPSILVARVE